MPKSTLPETNMQIAPEKMMVGILSRLLLGWLVFRANMECKPIAFYKGFPSIKGGDGHAHYHEWIDPGSYGCIWLLQYHYLFEGFSWEWNIKQKESMKLRHKYMYIHIIFMIKNIYIWFFMTHINTSYDKNQPVM